jgi:hypothetical protein
MGAVEEFVATFARVWSDPQPDQYAELWHEDGTLLHPGMEEPLPASQIPDYVRRLLSVAPDIRLAVDRWAAQDDFVLIEWTITTTFRDGVRSWSGVDRFTLRGNRAVEGIAYFDMMPIWAAVDPSLARDDLVGRLSEERAASSA